MMETENGNRFYDESGNQEQENSYNRFNGNSDENNQGTNRREGRPRFVRVDYNNNRPQYSRVERPQRQDGEQGYSQDRPRQQYGQRQQYGGGYQNRGYNNNRPQYGQQRYNQPRQYNNNGEEGQPRFYRERVQGGDQQEGGYQRQGYGQRQGGYGQRQGGYQQRQGGYGQRQGGYGQRGYGQQGGFRKPVQKRQDSRKRIEYQDVIHDPEEEIRLNKYLANAGVCSRREADEFIQAGVVKVNGQTVTELGTKVHRGDNVLFHDQLVSIERKIYILLNKPKDCVTTVDDPQERKTVMDYIKGACKERVYPVGRLDRNTTGVLLLTNDGEMASRLTHPKFLKKKIYHARLERAVSAEDLQKLLDGVNIGEDEGDIVRADEVSYVNDDKTQVGIEIHSGRNRVVRRMFDALGYRVTKLDRVQFAGLTKKRLRRGDWRFLTEKEVNMLRMGAYE